MCGVTHELWIRDHYIQSEANTELQPRKSAQLLLIQLYKSSVTSHSYQNIESSSTH
jgi:hypothetical protein